MPEITGDMKVSEVIRRWPATIDIFLGRGCPDMRRGIFAAMARIMSVRAAARMHRIDLGALLADLNATASRSGLAALILALLQPVQLLDTGMAGLQLDH